MSCSALRLPPNSTTCFQKAVRAGDQVVDAFVLPASMPDGTAGQHGTGAVTRDVVRSSPTDLVAKPIRE